DYIYRQGGSLLMLHAASDFIPCPGTGTGGGGQNIHEESCRFLARAAVRQYYHHQSGGTPMTVYVDSTQSGQIPPHASLGGQWIIQVLYLLPRHCRTDGSTPRPGTCSTTAFPS